METSLCFKAKTPSDWWTGEEGNTRESVWNPRKFTEVLESLSFCCSHLHSMVTVRTHLEVVFFTLCFYVRVANRQHWTELPSLSPLPPHKIHSPEEIWADPNTKPLDDLFVDLFKRRRYHQDIVYLNGTRLLFFSKPQALCVTGKTISDKRSTPPRHLPLPCRCYPRSSPLPPAVPRGSPVGWLCEQAPTAPRLQPSEQHPALPQRKRPHPAMGKSLRSQLKAGFAPPLRCHVQWSLNASKPANHERWRPGAATPLPMG